MFKENLKRSFVKLLSMIMIMGMFTSPIASADTKMPGQPDAQNFEGNIIWSENFDNFDKSKYWFEGSESLFSVSSGAGKLNRTFKTNDPSGIFPIDKDNNNNRNLFDCTGKLHAYANFMIESSANETYWYLPIAIYGDTAGVGGYLPLLTVYAYNGYLYAINTTSNLTGWDQRVNSSVLLEKVDYGKWYTLDLLLNVSETEADTYYYTLTNTGTNKKYTNVGGASFCFNQRLISWNVDLFDSTKIVNVGFGNLDNESADGFTVYMDDMAFTQAPEEEPTPTVKPTKMPGQPDAQNFEGDVIWSEDFDNFDSSKYWFDGSAERAFSIESGAGKLNRTFKANDPMAIYLKENNKKPFDKSGALHVYTNFMIEEPASENYQFSPIVLFNDVAGTDSYRSLVTVYAYNGKLYAINTDSNVPSWNQRIASSVELEAVDYGKWYTLDLLLNVSGDGTDKYYYTLTNTDTNKKYTNIGGSAYTLGLRWSSWNVEMFDGTKIVNVGFGNLDNDSPDGFTVYMDDMAFTQAPSSKVTVNADGSTSFGVNNNIEILLSDELASSDNINAILLEMKGSDGAYTGIDAIRSYDAAAKKITINAELWYNREYRLTIPDSLFTTAGICVEGKVVTFKTESMPIAIGISDVIVNGSAAPGSISFTENVKISARFTNNGNNTSQPATLIAAIYDGGVMKSVVFTRKTLALGASEVIDVTLPLPTTVSDNAKIKIFTWDDFASQTPMSDAKEITITK